MYFKSKAFLPMLGGTIKATYVSGTSAYLFGQAFVGILGTTGLGYSFVPILTVQ